jgi:predicted metalloprotease with PDZ domain
MRYVARILQIVALPWKAWRQLPHAPELPLSLDLLRSFIMLTPGSVSRQLITSFVVALLPWIFSSPALGHAAAPQKPGATAKSKDRDRTQRPKVHYILTPRWQGDSRHFLVEARLPSAPGKETVIDLPDEFGPARNLHANIRTLESLDPRVVIRAGAKPGQRVVTHPPGQALRLRYEVHNKQREAIAHDNFYDPILEPGWFQFLGHAAFIQPAHLEQSQVDLTIEWRNLPADWSLAGSHGARTGATTVWSKPDINLQTARHAVYVGGDFRVHQVLIGDQPLAIALRGDWAFRDEALVEATRKVVAAHREFWNDFDFPQFLITLIPNGFPNGSYGGTGLFNAFAMHVARDFTPTSPAFDFLIGHEHLHTWMPGRIGIMGPGADEAFSYWFSEGFTNWLTHRLLVKSGFWTRERYAEAINRVIQKYLASPARNFDNRKTADNFWKRRDAGDMPYQRGELIALRWSLALANKGESMDAVLKSLRTRDPKGELATTRLGKALAPRIDGFELDIARFVDAGETMELTNDLLGPCFEKRDVLLPVFEAGFNFTETIKNRVATGVVPESAAWKAGLREGHKTRRLSIRDGDVNQIVKFSVIDESGKELDFEFRPVKDSKDTTPQYFVRAGAAEDAACKAWF